METTMSALVWIGLLGSSATLARLVACGLWRRYIWFSTWTVSSILKSAAIAYATSAFGISSKTFITTWQWTHGITALLLAFAGIEAYSHIANDYPRIGNYGRRVLLIASTVATVFALMPLGLDTIMDRLRTGTLLVSVLVRVSAIAVGLGLLFAVSHIRSVPIPERRNLFYHRWLMLSYCFGNAVGMTMMVATEDRHWGLLYMSVGAACWCLWPVLLTKRGEGLVRRDFTDDDRLRIRAAVVGMSAEVTVLAEKASARAGRHRARY